MSAYVCCFMAAILEVDRFHCGETKSLMKVTDNDVIDDLIYFQ